MKNLKTLLTVLTLTLITSCSTSDDSSEPQVEGDCYCQIYATPVALNDTSIVLGSPVWVGASESTEASEEDCSDNESVRFIPNRNPQAPSGWNYPNVSTEDVNIRLDKECQFITE